MTEVHQALLRSACSSLRLQMDPESRKVWGDRLSEPAPGAASPPSSDYGRFSVAMRPKRKCWTVAPDPRTWNGDCRWRARCVAGVASTHQRSARKMLGVDN